MLQTRLAPNVESYQDDILIDREDDERHMIEATPMNDFEEKRYVILSDKENSIGEGKSTHAVDIFAFIDAREIPFRYFDTPYFLTPAPGGEKIYALLRETLRRSRKIGIAHVVIQMRQQLAALVPHGESLVLNTLRCENERERCSTIPSWRKSIDERGLSEDELALARMLINSMTEQWDVLLRADSLENSTETTEPLNRVQSVSSSQAPEIIRLEDLLDWLEEQDEDFLYDSTGMLPSRPHRFRQPPASRLVGLDGRSPRSHRKTRKAN